MKKIKLNIAAGMATGSTHWSQFRQCSMRSSRRATKLSDRNTNIWDGAKSHRNRRLGMATLATGAAPAASAGYWTFFTGCSSSVLAFPRRESMGNSARPWLKRCKPTQERLFGSDSITARRSRHRFEVGRSCRPTIEPSAFS